MQGTSMAAPHVAGAFAVLRSKYPNASVDEMLAVLKRSGHVVSDQTNGLNVPRIQVNQALLLLAKDEAAEKPKPKPVKKKPLPKQPKKPKDPVKKPTPAPKPAPVEPPEAVVEAPQKPPVSKPVPIPVEPKPAVKTYDGFKVYTEGQEKTSGNGIRW